MGKEDGQAAPPPIRTTTWAYVSLLCSFGVFCPLLTALGPVLGIKALAEIRSRPGTGGTAIAVTGMVIGIIVTLAWGGAAYWWHRNIRQPILHGPIEALTAGLHGDVSAFKSAFHGPGAVADDDAAEAFLAEVRGRYGMVINMVQDETREPRDVTWGAISPIVPYLMTFESAFVGGEAEFVILDDDAAGIIAAWRWIIIRDPELGDLTYPSNAERVRRRTLEDMAVEAGDESNENDADDE